MSRIRWRQRFSIATVILTLAGGLAAAQQRPSVGAASVEQNDARRAALSGRVIGADTGQPLRRARVMLTGVDVNFTRTATTGADGGFTFDGLPEGRYRVIAERTGYLRLAYGQTRPFEQGRPLLLQSGRTLDRLEFTLPRAGAIHGRVVDETGDPMAGVQMYALAPGYVDGRRQWVPVQQSTTDDVGEYRIANLQPGAYLVLATLTSTWTIRENGAERVIGYAPTYSPGVADPAGADAVRVGFGQRVIAGDLLLLPARMSNVFGTVVNSAGEPSAGETVYVSRELRTTTGASRIEMGGSLIEPDGSFAIRNLAPGEYRLAIRDVDAFPTMHVEEATVVMLSVNGEDVKDLPITTAAAWRLDGLVRTPAGAVPGTPNGRIRVALVQASQYTDRAIGGAPPDNGLMSPDGRFRVEHVFGPARFAVTLPDGWMLASILHNGRDVTDDIVEGASRQVISGVEVVVSNQTTSVSGHVTDARGTPAAEGTVVVFSANPNRWANRSRYVRMIRPDQGGQFDIRGLPPDDYHAVAFDYVPEGAWNDPSYLAAARPYAERIQLDEGRRVMVSLRLTAAPQ